MRRCGAAAWSARSSSFSRSAAHRSHGATAIPTNGVVRCVSFSSPSASGDIPETSSSGGRFRSKADLDTTSTSYRTGHSTNFARSSARSAPRTPCSPHGDDDSYPTLAAREPLPPCEPLPLAATVSSAMSLAASGTGASRTADINPGGGASASSNRSPKCVASVRFFLESLPRLEFLSLYTKHDVSPIARTMIRENKRTYRGAALWWRASAWTPRRAAIPRPPRCVPAASAIGL